MRDMPVFIPCGEQRLAATITLPDSDPRGLVVLMTGVGAPRSHRFQMWTRASRRMAAELGLASLRFDYVGMGESTGTVERWGWRAGFEVRDQGHAAVEVGLAVTGVERFAAVGNCIGGALAFGMAGELDGCVGSVSFLTHLLLPDAKAGAAYQRMRKSRIAAFARNSPWLKKHVVKPIRGHVTSPPPEVEPTLRTALTRANVLFVYGELDHSYSPRLEPMFRDIVRSLPPEQRERFEFRVLQGERLGGFESIATQDMVMETTVAWVERCFLRADTEPEHDARRATGGIAR